MMKWTLPVVVVAAGIARSTPAPAEAPLLVYMTGEALTKDCRAFLAVRRNGAATGPQQLWDAGECYGFVEGVIDHFGVMNSLGAQPIDNIGRFCLTAAINVNDATEVVARYTDEHPEERSMAGYFLVRRALAQKFPCP